MIYTTLKANKEHNIDYFTIMEYTDMNWFMVADLFEDGEQYVDGDYTNFDKLMQNYTERQIASNCLKGLKAYAKNKNNPLAIWNKMFIDFDCDGEIAFEQIIELIEDGIITNSNQIREIEAIGKKRNRTIKSKAYCYNIEKHYYKRDYIEDLIDKYFPCYAEINDDNCNNCGNCQ